ncbi:hypothetical protein GC207_01415 [bacterium]|nr:hypothetical protein [bacterium]
MADEKPKDDKKQEAAASGGGIKAMLPLIITVVLMPALAFVMTKFVMMPKLQAVITASATTTGHEADSGTETPSKESEKGEHGSSSSKEGHGETPKPSNGEKASWQLTKVIVNVAGTQATRYLMSAYTLIGKGADFSSTLEANTDQIRDVTSSVLSGKTIQDLEKPDSRAIIKAELMSAINTALGKPLVQEIYITEFAIQ